MSGQIIPKGDKKWLLRVFLGSETALVEGKRVRKRKYSSKGFSGTISQAQKELARMLVQIEENEYVPRSSQTLGEFLDHWLERVKAGSVSARTLTFYRGRVQTVRASLGGIRLDRLTTQGLQVFVSSLSRERNLSPATVRHVVTALRDALNTAVTYRLISKNPCVGLKLPRGEKIRTIVAWDSKQVASFLDATKGHSLYALWHVLLNTGMRPGEAFALRWTDLRGSAITVRQAVVELDPETVKRKDGKEVKRLRYGFDVPKTGAGRMVELSDDTIEALQRHRRQQAQDILAAGENYQRNDFIFARPDGNYWTLEPVSNRWETCVKRAKLPTMSLYGCRHTHATILLGELKVPLKVVAERLGNSPDILMKHYHHVLPGMQSSAIAEYGALLQKAKEA